MNPLPPRSMSTRHDAVRGLHLLALIALRPEGGRARHGLVVPACMHGRASRVYPAPP